MKSVRLSGPTLFAPVISAAAQVRPPLLQPMCATVQPAPACGPDPTARCLPALQIAAQPSSHLHYYVLLIITDGWVGRPAAGRSDCF